MNFALARRPSVVIPILLSLAAFLTVLGHVALYGAAREPDEGAAAHIFQLLLVLQVPFVLHHAARWLARAPMQVVKVLLAQCAAVAIACLPVYLLGL